MWTDNEITDLLKRVNPLPDPEVLPDHSERLWASLESKRTDRSAPATKPIYRRRAALVAAVVAVLVASSAVGAAFVFDADVPPLDREFDAAEQPILTVYGNGQGIADGCAWRLAFASTGRPLVGGPCGVFELTDDRWEMIADEAAVGVAFMDVAVDGEGVIWVASPDQPLRRLMGDGFTEMEIGSPWIAAALDGTIWAVDFGPASTGGLVAYTEGVWRTIEGTEMVTGVAVGSDGVVWILAGGELTRVSQDTVEIVDFEGPRGSLDSVTTTPDGAVWFVAGSNDVVDRLGVSDTLNYIVRYDGGSSTRIEVPFAEISDLAVHPDGTVWASSSLHGIFSYDGESWTRYGVDDGMPANEVYRLDVAPDGSVYAATAQGVVRIRPKS